MLTRWQKQQSEIDILIELELKKAKYSEIKAACSYTELYEHALFCQQDGDNENAAFYFWSALICGESAAAYHVYKIFKYADIAVDKKLEIAVLGLHVGKILEEPNCINVSEIEQPQFCLVDKLVELICTAKKLFSGVRLHSELINVQDQKIVSTMEEYSFYQESDECTQLTFTVDRVLEVTSIGDSDSEIDSL